MKKSLFVMILLFSTLTAFAKINTVVSILPQKTFLEKIGGEHVAVTLMVTPGSSPHSFEPKPTQMKEISRADLYFAIGIEFEEVWLPRFNDQNQNMRIVFTQKGIEKMKMAKHEHHEEHDHHADKEHEKEHQDHAHKDKKEHDHDHHEGMDPHVWTSPANVRIIAKNMADALIQKDPKHAGDYKTNLNAFLAEIDVLDQQIRTVLKPLPKQTKFMVFHPAWGYFARDYHLIQLAIEVEGKEPKPKQLAHLIEEAREENVHVVLTAPEFSDKSAKTLAKEIQGSVVKISPLNPKWSQNLLNLAKTIAKGAAGHE